MQIGNKEIFVVGDRILVKADSASERTKVGLYLPQSVIDKEPVQSGHIIETGPGIAIPNFAQDQSEPWQQRREKPVKYIPVQCEPGDYVLFLRKDSVEIKYDNEEYMVVPQNAILLIIREQPDQV